MADELNMTAWELFELITFAWYGKQYYFLETSGWVYSRLTHKTMSQEDALQEFLDSIEEG